MDDASTAGVRKRAFVIAVAVAAVTFAGIAFSIWRISTVAAPWAVVAGFTVAVAYALALAMLWVRRAPGDDPPAPLPPPRAAGKPRLRRVK